MFDGDYWSIAEFLDSNEMSRSFVQDVYSYRVSISLNTAK